MFENIVTIFAIDARNWIDGSKFGGGNETFVECRYH